MEQPNRDGSSDHAQDSIIEDSDCIHDTSFRNGALSILIKVIGETIGTFFLFFFLCSSSMGDYLINGHMSLFDHALIAGFTIMVIVFSIGHISGSHVNPSITIAFASIGKFPWIQVPFYVIGQLVGGLLGSLMAKAIFDVSLDLMLIVPPKTASKAFLAEFSASVIFMFLACSVSNEANVTGIQAAITIAIASILNIVAIWPISGAAMNPVRSLAPAILARQYKDIWIYIFSPLLGTIFGAWFHKLFGIVQNYATNQTTLHKTAPESPNSCY